MRSDIPPTVTSRVSHLRLRQHLAHTMLNSPRVDRSRAHAQALDDSRMFEAMHVTVKFRVPYLLAPWGQILEPNLPWAEDHFQERVSGKSMNPAPSEAWWPYAQRGNSDHKKDRIFSHTYPERFWPKRAGHLGQRLDFDRMGIRFPIGDLSDAVSLLVEDKWTRQAYVPVWFPEDLRAAVESERVPCSLGYHFISNASGDLDCVYTLRSCDFYRFFDDDMYMAGRLLQWVAERAKMPVGHLVVHIDNLHCFAADEARLTEEAKMDKNRTYNFEALL